jgi:putative oxidoreductase
LNNLSTLQSQFPTAPPRRGTKYFVCRALAIIVAAIFVYAGVLKILDPVAFARDIDNYKILPWPLSVALAFYLPWLEVFCGLALLVRFVYRAAVSILLGLTLIFVAATIAAKARGLDISCGCFGHVSQHWSFAGHLLLDFALLAVLSLLWMWRWQSSATANVP